LGNTCFVNVVVQALAGTPSLMNMVTSPQSHSELLDTDNVTGHQAVESSLRHIISSAGNIVKPAVFSRILRQVMKKSYRPGAQVDCHEYFLNLLEWLRAQSRESAREHSTPCIPDAFGGLMRSRITCKSCGQCSDTWEPFTDLSLELSESASVVECLHHFTKSEEIGHRDAYRCAQCKHKHPATKQLSIETLPDNLCLHLKRFSCVGNESNKIERHVPHPLELNMGEYLSTEVSSPRTACTFGLYAVIVHDGSTPEQGHYFAYVKYKDNKWMKLDDKQVIDS